ncbi:unnamed protein product [Protopolystoma xenopodis]|uniref:Guanylate cyclase domain-containing protein n=1 Tax=Protopolystoma xenopodis TaxID=117903 RepID=A0A3S5B3D0_9PLAT|nr:unnamed protein product [Protopolystoma xenopodis]
MITTSTYKIHCSNTTYELLVNTGCFTFEQRGTIAIKGKGEMKTWWVLNRVHDTLPHDCCPLPDFKARRKLKAALVKAFPATETAGVPDNGGVNASSGGISKGGIRNGGGPDTGAP